MVARRPSRGPKHAAKSSRAPLPANHPVAIVVVTWNSAAEIDACLASAFATRPAEVVVVDNASSDDTLARVRHNFPQAKVLPQSENLGFAAGCNAGIAATQAPLVLMLNADATLAPDYLERLVASLESHPQAASAVGKLVYEEGGKRYIDSAGIGVRHYALCPVDIGIGELDQGQYDTAKEIFGPSAAAALYRRAALDTVGPEYFDAALFAYYEDVDLAWRLNRNGFSHRYEPAALAYHCRRGPHDKPTAISERAFVNRYRVFAKNESLKNFVGFGALALAWEAARMVRRLPKQPALALAVARALPEVVSTLLARAR